MRHLFNNVGSLFNLFNPSSGQKSFIWTPTRDAIDVIKKRGGRVIEERRRKSGALFYFPFFFKKNKYNQGIILKQNERAGFDHFSDLTLA